MIVCVKTDGCYLVFDANPLYHTFCVFSTMDLLKNNKNFRGACSKCLSSKLWQIAMVALLPNLFADGQKVVLINDVLAKNQRLLIELRHNNKGNFDGIASQ